MIPVGVLLVVLAIGFGVGFLVSPGESADIQFYGLKLQDLPARNLVILGIVTGLIAALGAESIRWGTTRWRRRRRLARRRRQLQVAAEREAQENGASPETAEKDAEEPAADSAGITTEPETKDVKSAPPTEEVAVPSAEREQEK